MGPHTHQVPIEFLAIEADKEAGDSLEQNDEEKRTKTKKETKDCQAPFHTYNFFLN